ncbi:response regulator [Paenibacillus sp. GCM10027626]|uniref:response regulator transcription factor n=1 Tax=Paenibacillus sp. GCM10027626 TaxID=3273411 RepID=UPI003628E560
MHRLLIVDDEPNIVKGLYALFAECSHLELEIVCAFSADEAIAGLSRGKIDVILSDIRMPGMNGLELLEEVSSRWPRCKVIFLSGYNDFQYVQSAMRNGAVDYLLKSDDDDKVVAAVTKTLEQISEELMSETFIEQAKLQLQQAIPAMRRDWIGQILRGEKLARVTQNLLDELRIALSEQEEVYLVFGRIDRWQEEISISDQELLIYAVQNIATELLSGCRLVSVNLAEAKLVWLIQPAGGGAEERPPKQRWDRTVQYVQGVLDTVQDTCRRMLKIKMSFVSSRMPVPWSALSDQYARLETLMIQGLGQGEEMLLTETASSEEKAREHGAADSMAWRKKIRMASQLELLLQNGEKTSFMAKMKELMCFDQHEDMNYYQYIEVYYAIALIWVGHLNQYQLWEKLQDAFPLDKLTQLQAHISWTDAERYFLELAELVFSWSETEREERTNEVVSRINRYIHSHLAEDTSLSRLSELVHLNPSYLCRFYKVEAGIGLSEFITETKIAKAKTLLDDPSMRILDVAAAVGFDSPSYFGRFFKREIGMSPQEYRDRHNQQKGGGAN